MLVMIDIFLWSVVIYKGTAYFYAVPHNKMVTYEYIRYINS